MRLSIATTTALNERRGRGARGAAGGAPRGAGAVRRAPRAATDVFTRSPRKQSVREFSANDSVFMALLLLRVLLLGALAAAADGGCLCVCVTCGGPRMRTRSTACLRRGRGRPAQARRYRGSNTRLTYKTTLL